MAYGWQVFSPTGQLVADDSMFNAFFLDYWQCPANFNNRTVSEPFSYPELRYSEVAVLVGPSPGSVGSGTDIDVSVTYPNGVPTVVITETVNDTVSAEFGSTFWIVATRIDANSPINDTYGLQLFDGSSGVSFVDGLPPLVYIGKGVASAESLKTYGSSFKGSFIVETWTNVPPLCFWKTNTGNVQSIGNVRNETVPYLSGVRKSSKAPTTKNYRWCLMVQFNSALGGTVMSDYNKEVFCFEPYHSQMDNGDTYGIQVVNTGIAINIGTQKPLYIQSLNPMASSYNSGNNLQSSIASNRVAISNAPYIMKWISTYNYDTVFWYTQYSHLVGIHARQSGGGTNYAGYSADWWQTQRNNLGYESYVIDYGMYT